MQFFLRGPWLIIFLFGISNYLSESIFAQAYDKFSNAYASNDDIISAVKLSLAISDPALSEGQIEQAVQAWVSELDQLKKLAAKRPQKLPAVLEAFAKTDYLRSYSVESNFADLFKTGSYQHSTGTCFYVLALNYLDVKFELRSGTDHSAIAFPENKEKPVLFVAFEGGVEEKDALRMTTVLSEEEVISAVLDEIYLLGLIEAEKAENYERMVKLSKDQLRFTQTQYAQELYLKVIGSAVSSGDFATFEKIELLVPGFYNSEENSEWQNESLNLLEAEFISLAQDDTAYPELITIHENLASLNLPDPVYFELSRRLCIIIGQAFLFRGFSAKALEYFNQAGQLNIPISVREQVMNAIINQVDMALTDTAALDSITEYSKRFSWFGEHRKSTEMKLYIYARRAIRHYSIGDQTQGDIYLKELEEQFPNYAEFPSAREHVGKIYAEASACALRSRDEHLALSYLERGLAVLPEHEDLLRKKLLYDTMQKNKN